MWFASRDTLDPTYEPHRTLTVWRADPFAFMSATLSGGIKCELGELTGQQWYDRYHATVTIPATAPAGNYKLAINGVDTGVAITVLGNRKRQRVTLTPETFGKIEAVPQYSDVTLMPGLYTLDRTIAIPPGVRLYGYGATMQTSAPRMTGGAYDQLFFWPPADDLAFHGITFLVANNVINGEPHQWRNIHWHDCTFKAAGRQWAGVGRHAGRNAIYSGCTFDRVAVTVSGGLLLDCEWRGLVAPKGEAHALLIDGGQSLCVARSRFDGTDRGPVLTDASGPTRGVLITDLDLRGISRVDNGNELILIESRTGQDFAECVFHRGRVHNCSGDINMWNGRLSASVFNDWILDDASIVFAGIGVQSGNLITNCEFRGGGVYFAGQATGNTVRNCAFLDYRNTRRNQVESAPYLYDANAARPVYRTMPVSDVAVYSAADANRPTKAGVIEVVANA